MCICCFAILFAADSIWKRFLSIRTDLGKLKKLGKSDQGAKKLTQPQRWKLQRYAFLEAHIRPRTQGEGVLEGTCTFPIIVFDFDACQYLLVNIKEIHTFIHVHLYCFRPRRN